MENDSPILDTNIPGQSSGYSPLPNSTAVLVLGIISIALCWCYGIIGVTTGIIALVLGGKGRKLYAENKYAYSEASFKNLNAGWICAIIGTILSALYLILIIIYIVIVGFTFSNMPWHMFK
jgi:hypothetical protein